MFLHVRINVWNMWKNKNIHKIYLFYWINFSIKTQNVINNSVAVVCPGSYIFTQFLLFYFCRKRMKEKVLQYLSRIWAAISIVYIKYYFLNMYNISCSSNGQLLKRQFRQSWVFVMSSKCTITILVLLLSFLFIWNKLKYYTVC